MPTHVPTFAPSSGHPTGIRDENNTAISFTVEELKGTEEMNRPFEFDVKLSVTTALTEAQINNEIVGQPFRLTLVAEGQTANAQPGVKLGSRAIEGIAADVRLVSEDIAAGATYYWVTLVQKHWLLGLNHRSHVFKGQRTDQIINTLLCRVIGAADFDIRSGFSADDNGTPCISDDDTPADYPERELTVQYQESDLDFLHRLLEADGIYYFVNNQEKLYFTDSRDREGMGDVTPISYYPSGTMPPSNQTYIQWFEREHKIVPETVKIRDLNYDAFDRAENKQATVASGDERFGSRYEHGRFTLNDKGITNPSNDEITEADPPPLPTRNDQVQRIADVRAQEIACQQRVLKGKTNEPAFRPAHPFKLLNTRNQQEYSLHNTDYLVTKVTHTFNGTMYFNDFEAIPKELQYRPPRLTVVPSVPGIMTAKVDGPGEDQAADIDEQGRYRVRLPFDSYAIDCPIEGTQSTRMRLAQPHAGPDYGIHFPNRTDTEMVFACIDGDPDRPVGLGVVPNPWNHTPVPTTKHGLRTQNPLGGALGGGDSNYFSDQAYHFDNLKNVIRTRVGHQIVMDDNEGGSNVGITIQTGNSEAGLSEEEKSQWAGGKNKYWFSRIDMGGYKVKSAVEQAVDIATEAVGYLMMLAKRDLTAAPELGAAIAKSTAEAANYGTDTFGNTTPVGVSIRSDQSVNLSGANGVNISSPNLFGMFTNSFFGDSEADRTGQHYAENITKVITRVFFQDLVNDVKDEIIELNENIKESKNKHPRWAALLHYKKNIKKQRFTSSLLSLLQRSGINISSAGELKMSSLQSTSVIAGIGGMVLKSLNSIEQKADKSIDLEAKHGISISTKGRKVYRQGGVERALDMVGAIAPPVMVLLKSIIRENPDKDVKTYPLSLTNEGGDISLTTGTLKKGKGGNIEIINLNKEEGKRKISLQSRTGNIEHIAGSELILRIGKWNDQKGDFAIPQAAQPIIKMEDEKLSLRCGNSSISLKADGTIEIVGKKILATAGGSELKLKSNKASLSSSGNVAVAVNAPSPPAGPPPLPPKPPDAPADFAMDPPGSGSSPRYAEHYSMAKLYHSKEEGVYKGKLAKYKADLAKHKADMTKWEASVWSAKQPTSSVDISKMDVKMTGKMNVAMEAVNVKSTAKLENKLDSTMLKLSAKALAELKGALNKIG